MSAIFSFISTFCLKQQTIILWCFFSLKFENSLFSNKLFRRIFCIERKVCTAENDQIKCFVQNQLAKIKNKIMRSFMLIYFILRLKSYIYNILLEIHLTSSGKSCCFLFLFLYCYGKMQFFIHCNFFCQKYKFIDLLYLQLIFLENTYYYESIIFFHGH